MRILSLSVEFNIEYIFLQLNEILFNGLENSGFDEIFSLSDMWRMKIELIKREFNGLKQGVDNFAVPYLNEISVYV